MGFIMEKLNFTKIGSEELKKVDKRGLSTLYLYWLENGKKSNFELPLFIADDGKGVLSVETFKRVFYAFQCKIEHFCDATIKSGSDGDESNYNIIVVTVDEKTPFSVENTWFLDYEEPKKADVKRESSKKTTEKSKAKKATAEAEAKKELEELTNQFNKRASMKIADHIQGKYKLKCDRTLLENEIMTILASIQ